MSTKRNNTQYMQQYREANRDEINKKKNEYYEKNKELIKEKRDKKNRVLDITKYVIEDLNKLKIDI